MKHLLLALLFVFSIAATASAQGVRFDSQVSQQATVGVTTNVVTIPQSPVISVCASPANAVPCTNKATTYTDSTLGTPCSTSTQLVLSGTSTCVTSPDAQNNWGVWVAAGQYTYTITYGGMNYGPYFVTAGSDGIAGLPFNAVQFNKAGILGGDSNFIYNSTKHHIYLTGETTDYPTTFDSQLNITLPNGQLNSGGITLYMPNATSAGTSGYAAVCSANDYRVGPIALFATTGFSEFTNTCDGSTWISPATNPNFVNLAATFNISQAQDGSQMKDLFDFLAPITAAKIAGFDKNANLLVPTVAVVNPGVFTNTQMNEYLQSLVNSINLTTENVAIYGSNYATDGISGGVLVGAGSTVQRVDGIAGYVHTSSTTTAAVGSYGQGRCIANSTLCWGANFVVQAESGITTPSVIGLEVDLNNRTGTDATDGQTNPEDGIRVVNGSTNRGRRGIWINSSTASWQEAATLSNYHTFGLNVGNGDSGSVAAQFIPPDDTSATELIGRNNANAATVWSILNNGTINTPNLNVPDGSGVSGGVLAGSQTVAANSNSVGVLFHSRDSGNVVRSGQLYQPSTNSGSWNYALPNATGILSEAVIEYCGATTGGTQACAKTPQALPLMVWGDVQLNTATSQSITTLPFTDALYSCSGSDLTTAAGIVSFNTYASASVTIVETGGANTDHLRYQCIGH